MRQFSSKILLTALVTLPLLTACGSSDLFRKKGEIPLEGERISVLELQKSLEPDSASLQKGSFLTSKAWRNEFWPQSGGYPNHAMQHLMLDYESLDVAWSVDIGEGANDEIPLTSAPVVVNDIVYVLDSSASVSAYKTSDGQRLWEKSIQNPSEDEIIIGGGIAYANSKLYATNGSNEVLALDPKEGSILWRQDLPAPSRAAPTIMEGRIFVTTLDNRLLALNADTGVSLWEHVGLGKDASVVGAASPAANFDIVVPAFSSGEITALRVENGSVGWSDNLSNIRRIGGFASLSDIRALPVIDKGIIYAISFGGRMVAIDERTGNRIWQREIGGSQAPWPAGNRVFVVSADNELVSLNRNDGSIHWVVQLDRYEDDDKDNKIFWSGPLFASERLLVLGSDGRLLSVDPNSGETLSVKQVEGRYTLAPIIAGQTLYLLSDSGKLLALR